MIAVGNTPLHLAMESAHAEAAALLIEAGADQPKVVILNTDWFLLGAAAQAGAI